MSNVSRNAKKIACKFILIVNETKWRVCLQLVLVYQIRYWTLQCCLISVNVWIILSMVLSVCLSETHNNLIRWDVLVLNLRAHSSQCYKEDGTSKNPDCPVCSKSLNKLAQPLPMAHCANSRLVCKISGEVMNENNPPMMLPNGYVYGYNVSTQH